MLNEYGQIQGKPTYCSYFTLATYKLTTQAISSTSCPQFISFPVSHGSFARHCGISPPPFDSLNSSFGIGDSADNVQANRQLIKNSLRLDTLVSCKQVHDDEVAIITKLPETDLELTGFDALVSDVPNVGLMIQQADCQAVMLFDSVKKVAANAHSGWRGSVLNIIKKTIVKMENEFDTDPADIYAAISPSLGPCCAEFVNFKTELPEKFTPYQIKPNYFDFWAISRDQLISAGVPNSRVYIDGTCTHCNHDYFSYRRDGNTGRGATVIGLV